MQYLIYNTLMLLLQILKIHPFLANFSDFDLNC